MGEGAARGQIDGQTMTGRGRDGKGTGEKGRKGWRVERRDCARTRPEMRLGEECDPNYPT